MLYCVLLCADCFLGVCLQWWSSGLAGFPLGLAAGLGACFVIWCGWHNALFPGLGALLGFVIARLLGWVDFAFLCCLV